MAEATPIQVIKSCYNCNKEFQGPPPKVCSRCNIVGYCSQECLRASWKKHRGDCDPANAAKLLQHVEKKVAAGTATNEPSAPAQDTVAPVVAPVQPAPALAKDGEEKITPVMPATGKAHVVSDGASLDDRAKAKLQALAGGARASNMRTFTGLQGERKTLTSADIDSTATVVFQQCKDCEYVIEALHTKLFIQQCSNCKFVVVGKIVTQTTEIYHSENIQFETRTEIFTVQTDASKDVTLDFGPKENFKMVVWAGCHNLRLRVLSEEGQQDVVTGMEQMADEYKNLREDIDQFKAQLLLGKLIVERVVRLDNGFPTTKRERDEFERRQEENLQKLAAQMGITINKKPRDGPKVGRNDPCPCGSGRKYKNCCA